MKRFLILTMLMCLSACQPESVRPQNASAGSTPQHTQNIIIQTVDGSITLPLHPAKTAVYDYAVLDSLTALGVIPDIAPDNNLIPYLEKEFQSIPHKGGTIFEPDLEQLNAIRPDVIFIGSGSNKIQAELEKIAPTVNMGAFGGHLIADGLQRLIELGKLFGKENQAFQLKQETEKLLHETRQSIQNRRPENALVVMVNGGKLSVFGTDSYFGWLYQELGLAMTETDLNLDKYGLPASFELIHKANPDVIFVIDRSSAVGEKSQSASQVLDNPLIHQTRAWQKGQIVYLSGTAFTAGGGIRQIQQDLTTIKQSFEKTD